MKAYHVGPWIRDLEDILGWFAKHPSCVVNLRRVRVWVLISEWNCTCSREKWGVRIGKFVIGNKLAVVNGGVDCRATVDEMIIDGSEGGEGKSGDKTESEGKNERVRFCDWSRH
jgi:hypothetical protein